MHPRILFSLGFVLAALALPAQADVWFSSAPSSVASNTSYYVAAKSDNDSGGIDGTDLTVYKNGSFFAFRNGTNVTAGAWTSDTGPQTVAYDAEDYDLTYGFSSFASTSVTIAAPPVNHAPSASLSGSTNLQVGETGTWNFSGADSDGNLLRWRFYNSTNANPQWTDITAGSSSVSGTHSQSFASPGTQIWNVEVQDTNLVSASASLSVTITPAETWTAFDEPQAWVYGTWSPDASTFWEDQTVTQTRTNTRVHNTGERSNLGNTRNLGSYTESVTETQTVPGPKPLNPRIVSSLDSWGAWSGSAPAETADNPPWSWGSWSPAPGWYWEDQPATTTTQTRTGTRTVTYTTGSYTQTRTGTHTDNWTNDRGNTWSTTSGLSGSQTIPSSTRTAAQSTSESQTVADGPRALNPRHVLSTDAWQDYSAWTPDASTVPAGQAFTQTRTFRRWLTDYWTNDRNDVWSNVSAWENSSESQPATGTDATAPTVPAGLVASNVTPTGLTLTWTASTDTGAGVALYEVFKGGVSQGTTAATSFALSGLTPGTSYSLTVRASDGGNWSAQSAALSVTTTVDNGASDTIAPSAPPNLQASSLTESGFTLTWGAAADNVGVTGYEVRLNEGLPVAAVGLSRTFTGLAPATSFSVQVRALDAADNASAWAGAGVTTGGASTGTGAAQSIWFDVTGDGIRDELVQAGTADFNYSINTWVMISAVYTGTPLNFFWFPQSVTGFGEIGTGFSFAWLPTDNFWINFQTVLSLDFTVRAEANRRMFIYRDASGSADLNPANWQLFQTLEFTTSGLQTILVDEVTPPWLVGSKFFLVKEGAPIGSVVFRDQDGNDLTPGIDIADPNATPTEADLRLPSNGIVNFSVWDEAVRLIGSEHTVSWKIWDAAGNALQRSGLGLTVDFSGLPFGDYLFGLILDGAVTRTKRIKTVGVTVKKMEFLGAFSQLTDYTADFAGSGGSPFNPRGWVLDGPNNPVAHIKGVAPSVNVTVQIKPAGRAFSLRGFSQALGLAFQSAEVTSTGTDQVLELVSTSPFPSRVDVLEGFIGWDVAFSANEFRQANPSGPHNVFLTWGSLGPGPTLKRVAWATEAARGATSPLEIATGIYTAIVNQTRLGSGSFSGWALLDPNTLGECDDLALTMKQAFELIGAGDAFVRRVIASTTPGAGNCLSPLTSVVLKQRLAEDGTPEFLVLKFPNAFPLDFVWNNFEGCTEAAGKYFAMGLGTGIEAIADDDCSMLRALRDTVGAEQWWVQTVKNVAPGGPRGAAIEKIVTNEPIP